MITEYILQVLTILHTFHTIKTDNNKSKHSVAMFPYEEEYNFALSLVKEAACLFTPAYNSHKNIETKESSSDLVTG